MCAPQILPLGLPYADYVLGVSDLTGELMRFAITALGRQGMMSRTTLDRATKVCDFVRACRSGAHSPACLLTVRSPPRRLGAHVALHPGAKGEAGGHHKLAQENRGR